MRAGRKVQRDGVEGRSRLDKWEPRALLGARVQWVMGCTHCGQAFQRGPDVPLHAGPLRSSFTPTLPERVTTPSELFSVTSKVRTVS